MRIRTAWLIAISLLSAMLAAHESWDNGEGGVLTDPAHEISPAVDALIREFRPGMDTSELN